MKFYTLIFLSLFLYMHQAFAEIDVCKKLQSESITDAKSCHAYAKKEFPDFSGIDDSWCENNKNVPLNNGRCESALDKLQETAAKLDNQLKQACDRVSETYKKCQPCLTGGGSQANCPQLASDLLKGYVKFNDTRLANLKEMMSELKQLENMGIKAAEEYADNLKSNEDLIRDPKSADKPNPATAAPVGKNSPKEVVQAHNGMTSGQILSAIEQVKNFSSISGNDSPGNVPSAMVSEQLNNAVMAKDLNQSIEKYSKSMETFNEQAKSQLNTLGTNNQNLNSMQDGGTVTNRQPASSSYTNAAGGAAMGGGLSGTTPAARSNAMDSIRANHGLSDSTYNNSLASKNKITTAGSNTGIALKEKNTASGTSSSRTAASSLKETLARDLSNRLGKNTSGASRMKTVASKNATGDVGTKLDAKGKVISAEAQKLAAAVGTGEIAQNGQMDFNSSEINNSMSEIMGEESLVKSGSPTYEEERISSSEGSRELASEMGSNVIQSEESMPLFERIRECHTRRIKTGSLVYGFSTRESHKQ